MRTILNFIIKILQTILSIVNIVLIIIIVLNLLILISDKVLQNPYPKLLDYTYIIVKEDNNYLNIKKDDLLLIDTRKSLEIGNTVMYPEINTIVLGKIKDLKEPNTTIENNSKKITIRADAVLGTVIKTIPNAGGLLNKLLETKNFITTIFLLIITSVLQNILKKGLKIKKDNKPDFNQLKNV